MPKAAYQGIIGQFETKIDHINQACFVCLTAKN